jgi:hypothetical protein
MANIQMNTIILFAEPDAQVLWYRGNGKKRKQRAESANRKI